MLASDNPLERWHAAVARVPTDSLLPLGFGNPTNEANVAAFLGDKLLGVAVAAALYRDTQSAQTLGIGRMSDVLSTATANKLLCEELVTILPVRRFGAQHLDWQAQPASAPAWPVAHAYVAPHALEQSHTTEAVLELAAVQQHNAGTMVEAAVAAVHFRRPDDAAPIAELARFLVARAREAGTFNFKGELLQRGGNISNALASGGRASFDGQARRFTAEASLGGARARGAGPSKLAAEQAAARKLFDALGIDAPDLFVPERVRVPLPPSPADYVPLTLVPPADTDAAPPPPPPATGRPASAASSAASSAAAVATGTAASSDAAAAAASFESDDDEGSDNGYTSARAVAASTVAAARASAVRGRSSSPLLSKRQRQRATSAAAAAAAAASAQRRAFGGGRRRATEWSPVRLQEKDAVANLISAPPRLALPCLALPRAQSSLEPTTTAAAALLPARLPACLPACPLHERARLTHPPRTKSPNRHKRDATHRTAPPQTARARRRGGGARRTCPRRPRTAQTWHRAASAASSAPTRGGARCRAAWWPCSSC